MYESSSDADRRAPRRDVRVVRAEGERRWNELVHRHRYLVFCNLSGRCHVVVLGERVLNLSRLRADWLAAHGHDLLLVETFVDPQRYHDTCYRAANWINLGATHGRSFVKGLRSAAA